MGTGERGAEAPSLHLTVKATMTLWLRLKNDSISCNASDE
jgi:hypothetical protein